MKLIKTLFLISATFIFSGCYFLDYVIPEEYFAVEETFEENSLKSIQNIFGLLTVINLIL